jgi:hypothetical protein
MRGLLLGAGVLVAMAGVIVAQEQTRGRGAAAPLPPPGYGSLTQNDLSLRVRTGDIEVRFVPLDGAVTVLLAPDAWESLRSLVRSRRSAIDSLARASGVSRPGLALVSFFGQRMNARFDPQRVTLTIRNRIFQPLGIIPFTPRFTSQQLNVREQVSAIFLFEEDLPVNDSFSISYGGVASDDWRAKQPALDRERARVALRSRTSRPDTTKPAVPAERPAD